MISIKTLLLYVAGILAIVGVTVVVTIKINNNNVYKQQLAQEKAKEAKSHEAWRHLMADGPKDTPPLGAALRDPDTIIGREIK